MGFSPTWQVRLLAGDVSQVGAVILNPGKSLANMIPARFLHHA